MMDKMMTMCKKNSNCKSLEMVSTIPNADRDKNTDCVFSGRVVFCKMRRMTLSTNSCSSSLPSNSSPLALPFAVVRILLRKMAGCRNMSLTTTR